MDVVGAELLAVPVEGGDLAVGRWGTGEQVVVALHGITANHTSWAYVAEELGEGLTLYAPDLRGRGASADLGGPSGLAHHARDGIAILDHAGIDRAVVVGHSMGAFVAAHAAVSFPERLDAVVLVDGGLPFPLPDGVTPDELVTATIGPAMERLSMSFASVADYHDYWRGHPSFQGEDWTPLAEHYFAYDLHQVDGAHRSRVVADVIAVDGRDTVTGATPPVEVLDGDVPVTFAWAPRGVMNGEPLYPWERVAALASRHPDLRVVRLEDVNHYTLVLRREGARQVADAIRAAAP